MRLRFDEEQTWLLRRAAILFAINKIVVVGVTVMAVRDEWGPRSFLDFLHYVFIYNFRYFDSNWFTSIAVEGYSPKASAFFPLYPLLIRGVSEILSVSALAAGVLISNVAFFAGLYFFLKLARLDLDRKRSVRAGLLLALFPTAFFFSSAYTEALFVMLVSLALYSMRVRRWGRAGGYAGLAAVTRNTGFLLGIPYLIEYWQALREPRETADGDRGTGNADTTTGGGGPAGPKRVSWSVLWVLLIGAGVLVYLGYLWWRFGHPLTFMRAEGEYGRGSLFPLATLYEGYVHGLRMILDLYLPLDWDQIYYITQLFFPTVVLVVLVTSFRKLRWSYWVIILYSLLIPLAAPANVEVIDYFVGFSRYTLAVVPLYLGLERLLRNRWVFYSFLGVCLLLLVIFTYAWSHHRVVA